MKTIILKPETTSKMVSEFYLEWDKKAYFTPRKMFFTTDSFKNLTYMSPEVSVCFFGKPVFFNLVHLQIFGKNGPFFPVIIPKGMEEEVYDITKIKHRKFFASHAFFPYLSETDFHFFEGSISLYQKIINKFDYNKSNKRIVLQIKKISDPSNRRKINYLIRQDEPIPLNNFDDSKIIRLDNYYHGHERRKQVKKYLEKWIINNKV